MGNIFRLDSPFMKFMTLITNLICVNVLWILCCIPVVTAGAATTAMYYVVFQYITHQDDAVLKPFFKAFRENFRGATPVWLLHLLIGAVMCAECFYLSQGAPGWLMVAFGVLLFLFVGFSSYLYPLMARYDASPKRAVFNSVALAFRHLGTTLCVAIFNVVPYVVLLFAPEFFHKSLLFWLVGGFSLIAYLNGRMLMMAFKKHEQ